MTGTFQSHAHSVVMADQKFHSPSRYNQHKRSRSWKESRNEFHYKKHRYDSRSPSILRDHSSHSSFRSSSSSYHSSRRAISPSPDFSTPRDCSNSFSDSHIQRHHQFSDLPLAWWGREESCKEAKSYHTAKIDALWPSREDLILQTTLYKKDIEMEKNMFPCKSLSPSLIHKYYL